MTLSDTPDRLDITERRARAVNGWPALLLSLALVGGGGAGIAVGAVAGDGGDTARAVLLVVLGSVALLVGVVLWTGMSIVSPGETRVVTFFGNYLGTIRRTGLTMTVPLTARAKVPVRIVNFETETLKVNERSGSPVQVSAIVVWQVQDTAKAKFAVDDYHDFIESQSESALRQVVARHPYDHQTERMAAVAAELDEGGDASDVPDTIASDAVTLREDGEQVADELATEVNARVHLAGLHVLEVRLSNLSYAPEIASAMLQRQQAQAVLDARRVVIDGAVGIVGDALTRLEEDTELALDPERRAAMTSNLLTVIVGGGSVQPVVNVGSIYG
ncbi:SPFH domain-containing protein [Nocardioides zeae]|uniref:SPFH domain-containing protein n=1 Tax=Nocardioides imazamoxiresistens TaxID=3231893 RepID=A0ABU3PU45_9ACTN|nr:SPFH domain-containing protein [Nocardioides zeae]MDT9592747.1 SPFH domain-containing protein [Nocardioides zeae]